MNRSVTFWALILSIALMLIPAACARADRTPLPTTERQDGDTTPTPVSHITENQAIATALEMVTMPMPEVTGVQNPRNPVARLMTLGEYEEQYTSGRSARDPATPVWVVQIEGESESAGIVLPSGRTQFQYSVVVLDARTGSSIAGSRSPEPIFP